LDCPGSKEALGWRIKNGFASEPDSESADGIVGDNKFQGNKIQSCQILGMKSKRLVYKSEGVVLRPMRSVVETIPCNGVKLFMQMTHECLWAY